MEIIGLDRSLKHKTPQDIRVKAEKMNDKRTGSLLSRLDIRLTYKTKSFLARVLSTDLM